MPYVVTCSACSHHLSISDEVFAKRVAGKKVSLRCTRCRETVRIDASSEQAIVAALGSGAMRKVESGAPATEPELDTGVSVAAAPPAVGERLDEAEAVSAVRTQPSEAQPPEAQPPDAQPVAANEPSGSVGEAAAPVRQPEIELTPSPVVLTSEIRPLVTSRVEEPDGTLQPPQPQRGGTRAILIALGGLVLAAGAAIVAQRPGDVEALLDRESKPLVTEPTAPAASVAPAAPPAPAAPAAPAPVLTAPPKEVVTANARADDAPSSLTPDSGPEVATSPRAVPAYVSEEIVLRHTAVGIRRAEQCHAGGRAAGTGQLFVTFAANGRVSEARLEGEPIASAPVARCVLAHARAILIPEFEGEPFTLPLPITLR